MALFIGWGLKWAYGGREGGREGDAKGDHKKEDVLETDMHRINDMKAVSG